MGIGDTLSGQCSVTKTAGTIYEGCCEYCGKPLPDSTSRRQFCNDTCRQAKHRSKTGKSARAGTLRLKAEIPPFARKGQPKTAAPKVWLIREVNTVIAAVRQSGVIECYHHTYGRGVIDLHRMISQITSQPSPAELREALHGHYRGWDVICEIPHGVWRCLFSRRKKWLNLPASEVYLLKFHPLQPPSHLEWIHKEDRVRVRIRRSREIHLDFNKIGVVAKGDGTYLLFRELPENTNILSELTEDSGKHHDGNPKIQIISVEDFNQTDTGGSESNNGL